jgi:carbamoyl-phosphate synthase large subunit
MVVNTPTGPSARADGYAIRAAAITAMDVTDHHDRAGAGGCGAGDRITGDLDVTPLQQHAADLDLYGVQAPA